MTLAVPRQSRHPAEAVALALSLTDAANQARFAREARVLPSSQEALEQVRTALDQEQPDTAEQAQIRTARLLSARILDQARVLVPALPGIKRLQKIVYTQLQRAMLGQIESDAALAMAADEWDRYSRSHWP